MTGPLSGVTIAVTRPEPGALADRLRSVGATVVHVPLIAVGPPADGGAALRHELEVLDGFDWLVVTSVNGARAVGAAALAHPLVRLAGVGLKTSAALASLAGRPVDLVPAVQRVEGLLAEFPRNPGRVLVAQADRAGRELTDGLRTLGAEVVAAEAYRTVLRTPTATELDQLETAAVVLLSSGSAAEAWSAARPTAATGPAVVAIGPMTASVAERVGIEVAAVARSPSDDDVIAAIESVR